VENRKLKRPLSPPFPWIIIILIWAVFGLYLSQLDGQSLWRDEILSLGRANQSLPQILSNINIVTGVESSDLHPPFYLLLLHGWQRLAGETEFAYRYLSVLMGILALPLFYVCGNRIWDRSSGIWTAVFACFSSFFFWYSQEARMYALLVVETLLVIYTLWPLLFPVPQKREFVYFGIAVGLTIYTHYTGIFLLAFALIAILAAWLFENRDRLKIRWKQLLIFGLGVAVFLLIFIPLLPNLRNLLTAQGFIAFAQYPPWWILQQGIKTFSLGSAEPPDVAWWQIAPFIILAVVGALALDIRPFSKRWRAILLGIGGLLGILVLFYAASFLQANYSNPRHLTILSAFWFLLMGHGLVTLYRRWWVTAVLIGGAALILSAQALQQTVTEPPMVRDDVRALAALIKERALPGDTVVWHNAVMSMVYDYYDPGLETAVIPRYRQFDEKSILNDLAAQKERSSRIWFVRFPAPPFLDEALVYDDLNEDWVKLDGVGFPASWAILYMELFKPLQTETTLPQDALPATLNQDEVTIRGLVIPPAKTTDSGTWATLYWDFQGDELETTKVCINLQDERGTMWTEACTFLRIPANESLPVEGIIAQELWLPIPAGLAPVPYSVNVTWDGESEVIGEFALERPLSTPVHDPITSYTNGLNLVDVSFFDETFHSGHWVIGDLLWQAAAPITDELVLQAQLVDWLGRTVSEQTIPVAPDNFPETAWQPNDLIRTRLTVPIPYRLEGRYRVQILLTDNNGTIVSPKSLLPTNDWTHLGSVTIEDWPLNKTVPENSQPLADDVLLGENNVQLKAYAWEREDSTVTINLFWQTNTELEQNVGTFIHIGQPGEPPLAQGGGPDWERPTQSWRQGEIIQQTFTIELPANLDDNTPSVLVGMYNLENPDQRLPLHINGEPAPDNAYNLGMLP
jgi:mannosyltransferase